ncbi:MAG TPA: prolipoprotein diacylglyceryl transferase [Candidatus Eisenbacteria bacterium]|nr:prolipoprotein diacylglyceryl transferase [Candidatus Eisenbacteria bacterium]
MYPVLFEFGGLEIRSYGVIVALSFLVAIWMSTREAERKGLDPKLVQDFSLYALIAGIIGARLYFVLFSAPGYFLENPWEIFAVWTGGIGVIGALIAGFLIAIWFCRKREISLLRFGDTLAPGMALGQTLGQFACLFNGDSYGRPTNLPWAITYTDPRSLAPLNIPLHPIEIYEMIAYFVVFLLIWRTKKRQAVDGFAFFTYLAGYGVARFVVDFFRGDPAMFAWGLQAAQVFGAAMILAGLAGSLLLRNKGLKFAP